MAKTTKLKAGPPGERILALTERERETFARTHRRSRDLYERAGGLSFSAVCR